jgi:hypothetical protein
MRFYRTEFKNVHVVNKTAYMSEYLEEERKYRYIFLLLDFNYNKKIKRESKNIINTDLSSLKKYSYYLMDLTSGYSLLN